MFDPFSVVLLGSVLGGAFTATMYGIRAFHRAEEGRIDLAWENAARRVKGRFSSHRGGDDGRKLTTKISGVEITADEILVNRMRLTRVRAGAPHVLGFTVSIRRSDSLDRAFSNARTTSDATFDEDFTITTNHDGFIGVWLDATTRAAVRASGDWALALEGGAVSLTRSLGSNQDGDELARAIRSAGVIAQRGKRLSNDWSALARKLGGVVERPIGFGRGEIATIVVDRGGSEAKIGARTDGDRARTVLRMPAATRHEGPALAALEARALELRAQGLRIEDGVLVVELDGIVTAGSVLKPLVALLFEAAAAPSVGPYR